ncbi:MAG: DNA recombination protein RmuC [Bacillota bacterium]|nr:DNA recombination protein RmuC [Bacillota bacterium]
MDIMTIGLIIALAVVIVLLIVLIILMISGKSSQRSQLSEQATRLTEQSTKLNEQSTQLNDQSMKIAEQNARISELNRQLNESMAQVNTSLGEMKSLSTGVSDLKRLMTNVKSRGIMGELQLGAILDDILAKDQYEENVAVKGNTERVEFAVKFPAEDGSFVYLPIDSKFPGDAYINLLDAYDLGDREVIRKTSDNLKRAILKAAKDIREKYIYPPYTTDFAIMFLPFEGLYAEVLRLNLVEVIQREFRVNVAGPTTMAAMLNSFQLGFKSLALQQSSGEVWDTLEKVRTEFAKFSGSLSDVQRKLDAAQSELENLVGTRTRTLQKALDKASRGDE